MGQLNGGRGPKNSGKAPLPPFRAMPERKRFFSCEVFPKCDNKLLSFDCMIGINIFQLTVENTHDNTRLRL